MTRSGAPRGDDVMTGGEGNDTYHVGRFDSDTIVEVVMEGKADRVHSYFFGNYDMQANAAEVENARLVGFLTGLNITGNTLNNTLEGNRNLNILVGGAGDDVIIVHDTIDTADGTTGSDTVLVDFSANLATTASWINIDNITLAEGDKNLNATGDANANILTGNDGKNVLTGGAGDDTYVLKGHLRRRHHHGTRGRRHRHDLGRFHLHACQARECGEHHAHGHGRHQRHRQRGSQHPAGQRRRQLARRPDRRGHDDRRQGQRHLLRRQPAGCRDRSGGRGHRQGEFQRHLDPGGGRKPDPDGHAQHQRHRHRGQQHPLSAMRA